MLPGSTDRARLRIVKGIGRIAFDSFPPSADQILQSLLTFSLVRISYASSVAAPLRSGSHTVAPPSCSQLSGNRDPVTWQSNDATNPHLRDTDITSSHGLR